VRSPAEHPRHHRPAPSRYDSQDRTSHQSSSALRDPALTGTGQALSLSARFRIPSLPYAI
jgi:hypothetical protein